MWSKVTIDRGINWRCLHFVEVKDQEKQTKYKATIEDGRVGGRQDER